MTRFSRIIAFVLLPGLLADRPFAVAFQPQPLFGHLLYGSNFANQALAAVALVSASKPILEDVPNPVHLLHSIQPDALAEPTVFSDQPSDTEKPIILVVDDEPLMRDSLRGKIDDFYTGRFEVVLASQGQDGLDQYEKLIANGRHIALIISDFRMPDMDGLEMVRRIHRLDPTVPVVIQSSILPNEVQTYAQGKSNVLAEDKFWLRKHFDQALQPLLNLSSPAQPKIGGAPEVPAGKVPHPPPLLLLPHGHPTLREMQEIRDTLGSNRQPNYAARIRDLLKKYRFEIESYKEDLRQIRERYVALDQRLAVASEHTPENAKAMLQQAQEAATQWPRAFLQLGVADHQAAADELILLYFGPVIFVKARIFPKLELVPIEDPAAKEAARVAGFAYEAAARELILKASRQGFGAYTALGPILQRALQDSRMPTAEELITFLEEFDLPGRELAVRTLELFRQFLDANQLLNLRMADTLRRQLTPLLVVIGGSHAEPLKRELPELEILKVGTAWDERPPESPIAIAHRGLRLFASGNLREALRFLEKAISLRPNFLNLYMTIGTAHFELGQYDKAVESYRRLLEHLPNYADAQFNLAWNLSLAGNPERAEIERAKAIALDPNKERMAWPPPPAVNPRRAPHQFGRSV